MQAMQDTPAPESYDIAQIADAFREASRPDEPEIREPTPGDLRLFYGLGHETGRLRDAVVRELRGVDEEALSHLDRRASDYFPRVIDTVVSLATVSIGGVRVQGEAKLLRTLLMADRDLLFKQIMLATYGEDKEWTGIVCPYCEAENEFTVHIPDYVEIVGMDDPEKPYTEITLRNGKTLRLLFPTGDDQFYGYAKAKATVPEMNTRMLERALGPDVPNAREFAQNMSIVDRKAAVDALLERPAVHLKEVTVSCSNEACEKTIPFAFGWADLLLL